MRLSEVFDSPYLQEPNPRNQKTERMRKILRRMKKRTPPGGTIRTTDEKYPHGSGMFSRMF